MESQKDNSLLFFLRIVLKNWKFLVSFNSVIGVISIITLLLIPEWYRSSATVVILEENSSPLSGVLSQFSSLGFGIGSGTNVETYMQYTNTKKMYDRIISEFDLMSEYNASTKEDAYENIFGNLTVSDNENKTFTISYSFKESPEKAKEIVSFIFLELDNISLEVDKAQATNFRSYIENYYQQNLNKLKTFEDSLITYQSQTGILDLQTQVQATLFAIADIEKQKVALNIEKNVAESTLNDVAKIQNINNQIESIERELSKLNTESNMSILQLDNLPEQGANYLRLVRDIEISTQVSEFLRLQYEQALLDEQKISSDLYLLDPPQVPEKRFKPARTKLLFMIMAITVFISLIIIRVKEYVQVNKENLVNLFDES